MYEGNSCSVMDTFSTFTYEKISDKMEKKTIGTIPKCNQILEETEVKLIPFTHIYMTARVPGLVQTLQQKVAGLN